MFSRNEAFAVRLKRLFVGDWQVFYKVVRYCIRREWPGVLERFGIKVCFGFCVVQQCRELFVLQFDQAFLRPPLRFIQLGDDFEQR